VKADADGALVVRPMEPRDAEAVTGLIVQLGYDRPLDEVVGWIERLEPDRGVAFVACLDTVGGDEVVGWIEVSLESHLATAPYALIGGLVVKDGVRGRGIGRLLCARAEQWAWEQGVGAMRVSSRVTRDDAHRFYQRDGYGTVKTSVVFEKKRPE
jgi:GNAT superfamily N-acetyltransferase